MMRHRTLALRLTVLFLAQFAALGWMVFDRAMILRNGAEVRLAVVPVDPRDLFRGDYVQLAYDISTLRPATVDGDDEFERGDEIWLLLDAPAASAASVRSLHRARPDAPEGTVAMRGRVTSAFRRDVDAADGADCPAPCATLNVDYGVEQYFVPEGEGRELETLRNDGQVEVVAAVDDDGKAAIKRLLVDGEPRYEEPLL